ncbi:MAG: transposase [Candidatus Marinimicrobia bacterium]|nr:transposase [Candidatus Neomarinimicrobiota bacterium]
MPTVWQQDWVVHIESVGNGENALKYLAPYVYRIAISNSNILACNNGRVTFRYKDSNSGRFKTMTLQALEFMRRFLQHVLPKGFQKIRYFGFLHPKNKNKFDTLRLLLNPKLHARKHTIKKDFIFKCPNCGKEMVLFDKTLRKRAPPLSALLSCHREVSIEI